MGKTRTRLAVALISGAVLALQLVGMRILSVRFWHHFSALVVSTALLGFGASGTALTLARRRVRAHRAGVMWAAALGLALAVPLAVRAADAVDLEVQLLSWDPAQLAGLALVELAVLVPMFFGGAAVGAALMDAPGRVGGHYAASLVGSGAGAVLTVAAMGWLSTPQLVLAISAVAWAAAMIASPGRRVGFSAACAVGAGVAALHVLAPWTPTISPHKALADFHRRPGTRTICQAEGALGRIDVVAGPGLHPLPAGLSLHGPRAVPDAALMVTDGDRFSAVWDAREADDFAFMDWTTGAVAYRLLGPPSVLVVGAGGGARVGLARFGRSRRIVALQPNRQVIALMAGPLRRRGGDVLLAPPVEVVCAAARGYLARTPERFDLIHLPDVPDSGGGVLAAAETPLLTVEAFRLMLDRCTPRGLLCVSCPADVPPRAGPRLLATAAEALRRRGADPPGRLAMIRSYDTITLIVSAEALSDDRLAAVRAFCDRGGFDVAYLPGASAGDRPPAHAMPEPYYARAAEGILGEDPEAFFDNYLFDVRPVTDDRPFFNHFVRPAALPRLVRRLGTFSRMFVELGWLLLLAGLVQAVPVAALLTVAPLMGRRGDLRGAPGKARAFAYVALIGVGFMALEMSFLQRLTLYLADPIYSAAAVIASFLVFAGIGSQLSRRWRAAATTVTRRAGLAVAGVAVIHVVALDRLLAATQAAPLWARVAVVASAVAPLAVPMGHMFPAALRRLGASAPALVPWCWGINGFASVVATASAGLLAMAVGFNAVSALAAGAYAAAALLGVEARRVPSADGAR